MSDQLPWLEEISRSNAAVYPLPGFPRNNGILRNGVSLLGSIGIFQNSTIATSASAITNTCGFVTYRNLLESWVTHPSGVAPHNVTYAYNRTASRTYSFSTAGTAPVPRVVATDVPVLRVNGEVWANQNHQPDGYAKENLTTDTWRFTADVNADNSTFNIGNGRLTDQITGVVLDGWLETWKSLPLEIRDRASGDYYALNSQSQGGVYGKISAFYASISDNIRIGSPALAARADTPEGYNGFYENQIYTVTRGNWPKIVDNERPENRGNYEQMFNSHSAQWSVSDEITGKIWKDDYGVFKENREDTFEGLSWHSLFRLGGADFLSFSMADAARYDVPGQDAEAEFLSADGSHYLLTLEYGYYAYDGWVKSGDAIEIELMPAVPQTYQFERVAVREGFGMVSECVRVTRIELYADGGLVLVGGEEFSPPLGTVGKIISDLPGESVAVLAVSRSRSGRRWGYFAMNVTESGADGEPPVTAKRYKKKKFKRLSEAFTQ